MSHKIVCNSFNAFFFILEQFFTEHFDRKMYLNIKLNCYIL